MKKKIKIFSILAIAVMVLIAIIIPFASVGATNYDATLLLENKDASWTKILDDGIGATLNYNTSGTSFDFNLSATGLAVDTEYSLIYYTDTKDRYNDWNGADGIVIANFITESDGSIESKDMSVFLGMSMPNTLDANAYYYDYTKSPDFYIHAHGAKVWLVPTSVLTNGEMPVAVWSPDNTWLFETDLISFEQLVSETVGFDGNVVNPMLTLEVTGIPDAWYNTATYEITIIAENPTDATLDGVYGKIIGWNPSKFTIMYEGMDLETNTDCGFWVGDVYYFGSAVTNGDTYSPLETQSFVFNVTPKSAGAFDIGIVLVSGIADPRND